MTFAPTEELHMDQPETKVTFAQCSRRKFHICAQRIWEFRKQEKSRAKLHFTSEAPVMLQQIQVGHPSTLGRKIRLNLIFLR